LRNASGRIYSNVNFGAHPLKSRTVTTSVAWITLILILLVLIIAAGFINGQIVRLLPTDSEFYVKWEATNALIFNGINPYENSNGEVFSAPLPVVLLFAPFALIKNYEIARAAWMTALQVATVLCGILCIKIAYWQIRGWVAGIFLLFAFLWYPAISIYIRGSETALIAAFFFAAMLAIRRENDEIAGVLLAFAALQPHVTLLGIVLGLLWAGSQHRWLVHFWMGIALLFLGGIGFVFVPSWLIDFFWSVLRNVDFNIGEVIIEITTRWWPGVGLQIGRGFVLIAGLILVIEWWLLWGKNERYLVWTIALTLVIAVWIGFEISIDHLFLLLLSLSVVFAAWERRWGRRGQIFMLLAVIILLPGLWWAYTHFEQRGILEGMNPIVMLGFPLTVIIGLYWVRWWFHRPGYLNLDNQQSV
jgi:hypothetical protein